MSGVTIGPGFIGVNPENESELAMHFAGEVFPDGGPKSYADRSHDLTLLGRSATGMMGIGFEPGMGYLTESGLAIPITVDCHTDLAQLAMDDIRNLAIDEAGMFTHPGSGENLPFGRLLDECGLVPLERDEVEKAIREKAVAFGGQSYLPDTINPDFTLNDDGSVSLPLSHLEFLINDSRLNPERRLNILLHGRNGIRPYVDTAERDSDESLTGFTLGGALFSTGPYYWRIRTNLNDSNYQQIEQAAFGDANRIMGIGDHLSPYERHRQVEIVRRTDAELCKSGGSNDWLKFGEARITLDLYKDANPLELKPQPNIIDWGRLSLKERAHLHAGGLNALDVIRATDPDFVGAVFRLLNEHDLAACIVTPHGVTGVDVAPTDKFNADNTMEAARSFGHSRGRDERLEELWPLSESLALASDRQQVIFAPRLLAKYIPKLVEATDIRALVIGQLGDKLSLSREDHAALTTLARKGTTIAWYVNDELRELHRSGLWVRNNEIKRMAELETVIAMYGSADQKVGVGLYQPVERFISGIAESFGEDKDRVAVIHGNGPGVMLVSHLAAQKHGVMSVGVGIDVEAVGQGGPNFDPEAFAYFPAQHRSDRQELMDSLRTIPIFNEGGIGTSEEAVISACTTKLLSKLPTPHIFVQGDGLYDPIKTFVDGVIDRKLADPWVKNIFHMLNNYDDALATVLDFLEDPKTYWKQIGIPPQKLELALAAHQETARTLGLKVDTPLARKAREFIAEHA